MISRRRRPIAGVWLATAILLCVSSVAAQTWVSIGPEGGAVAKLLQDPANNNTLYVLSGDYPASFYKSTNKGGNWNAVVRVQGSAASFAINGKKASEMYMGGYSNFSVSTNSGTTWTSNYHYNKTFYALSVDSANQSILHASGYEWNGTRAVMAYFKSTNKGSSWTSTGMPGTADYGYANALAVDPKNSKNIWVGGYIRVGDNTFPKVFRTTNSGTNWTDVTGTITGFVEGILIDSTNVKRVFVLTYGGVFKSTDNGTTWSKNSGSVYGYKLTQDPKNKNTLYAGYYNQVFKSTDGGSNWTGYTTGLTLAGMCNGLCVDRGNSLNIFYGGSMGFYRSTDGGVNWNAYKSGLLLSSITSVKIAQGSPQLLYAAFAGDGLYKTTNPMGKAGMPEAVSWTRLPTFYDCHNLTDLQISPTDPNVLYAFEGGG